MGNRLAVGAILMLTLFFFVCGKPISGDTVYRFPDQVTEVAVTCYGGGEVAEVTLDAPDVLRAVANWYAGLRLVALKLKYRGYNVDVGMVEIMERNADGKQERKRLEVDFVANQGSKRYYIQSALRMEDDDKVRQEKKSLINIPDSFKKIIVVKDRITSYHDYDGILRVGLFDFLLNPDSLDL